MFNKLYKKLSLEYFAVLTLYPIFFILHGYNSYFGLLPFEILASLFLKYTFIVVGLFYTSEILFRNSLKAFIFTFLVLCIFFFFGAMHDWLKIVIPIRKITSYSVILPVIILILGATGMFLYRVRSRLYRIFLYARLLLVLLACWEVGVLCFNALSGKAKDNDLAINKGNLITNNAVCKKPDIFFIVFDEYASTTSLKNDLGFDNSSIDSALKTNNFFVSKRSQSNYNYTFLSLGSTFNLGYLNIPQNHVLTEKLTLQGIKTIYNNVLIDYLRNENYYIVNYGYFDFKNIPVNKVNYFDRDFNLSIIDNQTFISRIRRDIWWNFTLRNFFTKKLNIPKGYLEAKQKRLNSNISNFENLLNELKTTSSSPRFIYVHMMLPHGQFYMDSNGRQVSDTSIILNSIDPQKGYIDQVKFANTLLKKLISFSVKNLHNDRVVIIEGDHGYRSFSNNNNGAAFKNLNAYYFSDKDYSMLYDGISPVNTFRVVLNKYFGTSLPILKDSSIYIKDPDIE